MGIKVEGAHHPEAFVLILQPDGSRADIYLRGWPGEDAIFLGKIEADSEELDVIAFTCRMLLRAANRNDEAKPSGEF